MQKVPSTALMAALTIMLLGISLFQPVPAANAGTNPVTEAPQENVANSATHSSTTGGVVLGGKAGNSSPKPGIYVVRTVWKSAPLSGVRVKWWRKPGDGIPALVKDTVRFGTAIFYPVSGTYYLTAEWRPDSNFARPRKPGDRFAWLGGNPLLVSSKISEMVTLTLEEVPSPPFAPPVGTGIFGRVTLSGVPAADVGVFAYAKTGSGLKGDDFRESVRTNAKGEFALTLPAGRYYLLARLRADNSVALGPLHKGDLLGYDPGNPITVVEGHYSASAIPVDHLKMVKSRTESSSFLPGIIEGCIIDRNGHPVPGVYAALYEKSSMSGRSVFRSEPVGSDGHFKLSVQVPGSYFLGARNGYGSPAAGGWRGAWNGSSDHAIRIRSGEVHSDVKIVVDRVLKGQGPPKNP